MMMIYRYVIWENKQHLLVLASLYYDNKDLFHIKMKEDIDCAADNQFLR